MNVHAHAAACMLAAGTGAFAQGAADTALEGQLTDLEKRSWVAWKGHDGAFFAQFLSDDHVEVGPYGILGKAAIVAGVAGGGCTVESYALDRFKFTRIAEDTALLSYRAEQKTTCGGQPVPSPAWVSSLLVKRGTRWVNVLYQRTPAAAP